MRIWLGEYTLVVITNQWFPVVPSISQVNKSGLTREIVAKGIWRFLVLLVEVVLFDNVLEWEEWYRLVWRHKCRRAMSLWLFSFSYSLSSILVVGNSLVARLARRVVRRVQGWNIWTRKAWIAGINWKGLEEWFLVDRPCWCREAFEMKRSKVMKGAFL